MGKSFVSFRLDDDLLSVIDQIAEHTGRTRTDVITAVLERGLEGERLFVKLHGTPVVREFLDLVNRSRLVQQLLLLSADELDKGRVAAAAYMRQERKSKKRPKSAGVDAGL
jgi:hypothetical protein